MKQLLEKHFGKAWLALVFGFCTCRCCS